MPVIDEVIALLTETLLLGERGKKLESSTHLLGNLPELDSMAVIHLITALEERFDIVVADDDISASTFETVASLTAFIDNKLTQ